MSPAESLREKLIYFLEYAPHLNDWTPEERRAECGRWVDEYAHELAEQIRAEKGSGTYEPAVIFCGGMGYAADLIDPLGAGPARPGEEPEDDGPEDGGHDFQWGDDRVQRCTRCRLPHSQWAGGLCPGPEHPFRPGEYV